MREGGTVSCWWGRRPSPWTLDWAPSPGSRWAPSARSPGRGRGRGAWSGSPLCQGAATAGGCCNFINKKILSEVLYCLPSSVFPVKVSGPPLDLQTGLQLLQHPAQTVHLVPAVHRHPQGGQVVSVRRGEGVGQCCLELAMKVCIRLSQSQRRALWIFLAIGA